MYTSLLRTISAFKVLPPFSVWLVVKFINVTVNVQFWTVGFVLEVDEIGYSVAILNNPLAVVISKPLTVVPSAFSAVT